MGKLQVADQKSASHGDLGKRKLRYSWLLLVVVVLVALKVLEQINSVIPADGQYKNAIMQKVLPTI